MNSWKYGIEEEEEAGRGSMEQSVANRLIEDSKVEHNRTVYCRLLDCRMSKARLEDWSNLAGRCPVPFVAVEIWRRKTGRGFDFRMWNTAFRPLGFPFVFEMDSPALHFLIFFFKGD